MLNQWLTGLGLAVTVVMAGVVVFDLVKQRNAKAAIIITCCTLVLTILFAAISPLSSPTPSTGNATPTHTVSFVTQTLSNTPSPSPTQPTLLSPTPAPLTPIPTAQSVLPYTSDWSHGPNGWPITDIWRVYGNALHCSGAGDIAFPFQLEPGSSGTTDYTVEWKATAQGGNYGITVRAGNDGSDYGYHISFNNGDINQVTWLYIFKGGGHIYGDIQKQYTVPQGQHDYIVTVKANIITIKVDGATILTKEDNSFVTGGSTSFTSGGTQVDITYVRVTQA